ncbi:MAG TPA: hypothetical protein VMT00_07920 [Thermoanaerobaculia bacterium]|nr:hypothetical protein [Thermoanaerobaculia bacterium]
MMRKLTVTVFVVWSSVAFAAPSSVHMKLAGSPTFGEGADIPVADAALFIDTTNFDGKSGFVRLQKGLTVVHLVLSSREFGCEATGEFEKKAFLQRNVVPHPRLPELSSERDYLIAVEAIDSFNPRKQSISTLLQALTATPITKLTSMAPWVGSVAVPSATPDSIHLHMARAEAITAADKGKVYTSTSLHFSNGGTVIAISPEHTALHLQTKRDRPPFDAAPVVLERHGESWAATIDIRSKEITVRGTLPIRMCAPVNRTIDEYAGGK